MNSRSAARWLPPRLLTLNTSNPAATSLPHYVSCPLKRPAFLLHMTCTCCSQTRKAIELESPRTCSPLQACRHHVPLPLQRLALLFSHVFHPLAFHSLLDGALLVILVPGNAPHLPRLPAGVLCTREGGYQSGGELWRTRQGSFQVDRGGPSCTSSQPMLSAPGQLGRPRSRLRAVCQSACNKTL